MKETITQILLNQPGIKAKIIARELGISITEVNSFLYQHPDVFSKDSDHGWSVVKTGKVSVTLSDTWVNGQSLDASLSSVEPLLDSSVSEVHFVLPQGCRVLLEAAARLLALVNQLDFVGKQVVIDFRLAENAYGYLDRVGFISHLAPGVTVLPERPQVSAADTYRDNSPTVVEFGDISPIEPDTTIPKRLSNRFVEHAGSGYKAASFTVFSELFGNVCEHSNTPIPGFAALQKYSRPSPHIQIVVSDSGCGIVGTLLPALKEYYPELLDRFNFSCEKAGAYLIKELLEKGSISQTGKPDRGLGLKRSKDYAQIYNANISIRQETFELKLSYKGGNLLEYSVISSLPKLLGTHVCFDFILDNIE